MSMDKELKKRVTAHFKAQGLKPRYRSVKCKSGLLQVWFPSKFVGMNDLTYEGTFSVKDRNIALDAVYGHSFERNRENPEAGNVRAHSFGLSTREWSSFLDLVVSNA